MRKIRDVLRYRHSAKLSLEVTPISTPYSNCFLMVWIGRDWQEKTR